MTAARRASTRSRTFACLVALGALATPALAGPPAPAAPPAAPPAPAPAPAAPAKAPPPPNTHFLPSEAADALGAKVARFPDDAALLFAWHDALAREDRAAEAVAAATKRHDAAPTDPIAVAAWGRLVGGDAARDAIRKVLEAWKDFAEGWQALSELEDRALHPDAAKAAADKLVEHRGSGRDWLWTGFVRERAGDRAGAITAYEKALSIDASLHVAKIGKAFAMVADGKAKDAVLLLEGDAAAPTTDPLWLAALAAVRVSAGDEPKARQALGDAVAAAASDRRALLGIVAVAIRMKIASAVRAALDAAVNAAPDDADWLAARAVVAIESGAPAEAIALLGEAAKARPKDARLLFLAGVAELRTNHVDKALAHFKAASALAPSEERYVLAIAHALDRKGSKDVLSWWHKAAELDPKDPEPRLCAGLWLNAKGKFEDAIAEFEAAVKAAPTLAEPHYFLAILQGDKLGMLGIALDHLREYKRLGGTNEDALAWLAGLEAMKD
ncbi:MAG: tetratricopeptide repeat protein [Planctomycetes bacterium]|nr:tetratricopeptide repeat protein [Planctomycetota bacterium]